MNWFLLALLAAVFTSLTSIFAKIGLKSVNSNFATAYKTVIVIFFSIIICLIRGSFAFISQLNIHNYLFLFLSGIATGLSWIFYYKALKIGDVNKVAPIDKCSFILTSILFLIFFFDDTTKGGNALTIIMLILSMILMGLGTILMITKKKSEEVENKKYLVFAGFSAIFASLVSLFLEIGLKNIESDLGTLFRTIVVFIFASTIVLIKKDYKEISKIDRNGWIFLTISGVATGAAWLLEYEALNIPNVNPVAVNSIIKLSIILTIMFSLIFLKEKISKKNILGLILLTAGVLLISIFSL